MSGGLPSAIHQ